MADACLFRRLFQAHLILGVENIPAHKQVTRDLWVLVLSGMMGIVINPVASGTYAPTVEGLIQEPHVL